MREELEDPRLIAAYARKYNEERRRLAAEATATRARLETKRTRIEGELQRTIDLVIKGVIGEEDARERIAELKARRLEVEVESPPSMRRLRPSPSILRLWSDISRP
jgi:hypothetical protein